MEVTSAEVERVTQYMKQVEQSLNNIVSSSQRIRDQIMQIAAAVEQQSATSEEIAKNITSTSGIAKEIEKVPSQVMFEVNKPAEIAQVPGSSRGRSLSLPRFGSHPPCALTRIDAYCGQNTVEIVR